MSFGTDYLSDGWPPHLGWMMIAMLASSIVTCVACLIKVKKLNKKLAETTVQLNTAKQTHLNALSQFMESIAADKPDQPGAESPRNFSRILNLQQHGNQQPGRAAVIEDLALQDEANSSEQSAEIVDVRQGGESPGMEEYKEGDQQFDLADIQAHYDSESPTRRIRR